MRVLVEPLLDRGIHVRGIVVRNQMQRLVFQRLAVYLVQKFQPLSLAMTLLAWRNDLQVQRAEPSEQRGRTIALIVRCHNSHPALLQRQTRLRALQRPPLA